MEYASEQFYVEDYLLGRTPKLPIKEFKYWEKSAREYIDFYTFNRIEEDMLTGSTGIAIKSCVCELAEYLYLNEGSAGLASESISGRSVSYKLGTEYYICQKHLSMTGLMYRGSSL